MVQVTFAAFHKPPSDDEWLHELKFDGYRMLCRIDRDRVTLWSRNGKDWTDNLQNVVEAVKSLKATSAMLDGEIVILMRKAGRVFRSFSARWAKPRRLALLTRSSISFISMASASLRLHSSIGKNFSVLSQR